MADTLQLACFGKLPFWPEYLERSAGLPTARMLRAWLHEGKETVAGLEGEEGSGADVPIRSRLRLLLGAPGSAELLVGVLRPSKDRGGRNFPFSVFAHVPRRVFGKHYALLPLGLAPVWESLDEAWDSLASVASKGAFEEVFSELQAPAPDPLKQVTNDYRVGCERQAEALSARNDGASETLLSESLPDVLARLKRSGTDGMALELPVARNLVDACFDAAFWIDLLNRQFFMKRFEPSVLLDEDRSSAARNVFLRFGSLSPDDYPPVMGFGDQGSPFLRPAHPVERSDGPVPDAGAPATYNELLARRFS